MPAVLRTITQHSYTAQLSQLIQKTNPSATWVFLMAIIFGIKFGG